MLLIPEKRKGKEQPDSNTTSNISVGKATEGGVCGMGYHTPLRGLLAAILAVTVKHDNFQKKDSP